MLPYAIMAAAAVSAWGGISHRRPNIVRPARKSATCIVSRVQCGPSTRRRTRRTGQRHFDGSCWRPVGIGI